MIRRAALGLTLLALTALAALYWLVQPPAPLALPERGVTLHDVTLIEPGSSRLEHRSLRVEGAEIAAVEAAQPGGDPFRGMYVLPGLTDMHVHFPPSALPGSTELFAFLFLYHGITAIRDAGDVDGTASEPARRGIRGGAFPGPRVFSCGPFVDGDPPLWSNSIVATTPGEGRAAVREIAGRGYECVKIYNELDADTLDAIRAAAHEAGLPVIGHVPSKVPYDVARLDDAQHLIGVAAPLGEPAEFPWVLRAWLGTDDVRVDAIIATSLEYEIANTPTLVTIDRLIAAQDRDAILREPDAQLLPRFYREVVWNPSSPTSSAGRMSDADFEMVRGAFEVMKRAFARMVDAGVRIHSGTDSLVSFVVPGASLHRELRLYVDAGLAPEQALRISTRDSARFLDERLGSLRVGAPAELVIYREDPTRSLDALDTIAGIVRDGRLYTRAVLDARLARYQAHFDGALYDAIVTPLVRQVLAATAPARDDAR